jgi:hypothetical protein
MKADLNTLGPVIGFIVNGVGVATLAALLDRSDLKDLQVKLSNALAEVYPDFGYVKRHRRKLLWELLSPWTLALHVINLSIYTALLLILLIGPEKLFSPETAGALAQPLTGLEKLVYWIWLVLSALAYIARCFVPTIRLVKLYRKAGKGIRSNGPKKQKTKA